MSVWAPRPPEIANLFNPAFCGILLIRAVHAYVEEADAGMPFILSFFPLPIVLHEPTREALPKTKATSMLRWLQRQPEVRVGYASRMRGLTDATREALMFAAMRGYLNIDQRGQITVAAHPRGISRIERQSAEYKQCRSKAEMVGRMLARAGHPTTILASWGVRP